MTLAEFLTHYLVENKMSLRQYSRLAGVPVMTLSGLIRGLVRPSWKTCTYIANYHGLNLDDVLRMAGHLPGQPRQDLRTRTTLEAVSRQLLKLQETLDKLAAEVIK